MEEEGQGGSCAAAIASKGSHLDIKEGVWRIHVSLFIYSFTARQRIAAFESKLCKTLAGSFPESFILLQHLLVSLQFKTSRPLKSVFFSSLSNILVILNATLEWTFEMVKFLKLNLDTWKEAIRSEHRGISSRVVKTTFSCTAALYLQ